MKYLCLAYEEEAQLNRLTRREWDELRTETLDYVAALRERGVLVDTHALRSATTATTVEVRNRQVSVTDGPFIETKEQIGGYFLIEADDLNQAICVAADWPSARIGTIEVRPIVDELPLDQRYD
ncbi:YciI family protein [Arhodomonas sp. AD133]|uniref:YciI family protein n=1 Tax=Arhodomonas sp. AD133 TaxID=3415009 RepID=UPI003EBCF4AF